MKRYGLLIAVMAMAVGGVTRANGGRGVSPVGIADLVSAVAVAAPEKIKALREDTLGICDVEGVDVNGGRAYTLWTCKVAPADGLLPVKRLVVRDSVTQTRAGLIHTYVAGDVETIAQP